MTNVTVAQKSQTYYIMKGYHSEKHYAKADSKQELSQIMLAKFPSCNENGTLMRPVYPEAMIRIAVKRR